MTGVITLTDIAERFHDTALPFFMIGEIESNLRKCLSAGLSEEAIRAVQPKRQQTGKVTDLMFGQYLKLIRAEANNPASIAATAANWQALGRQGVDRDRFISQLSRVKDIRNHIAHFGSRPPGAEDIDTLRRFSELLKMLVWH
ncbi:hypothetical protein [Nocardia farcinica]|uniref:hypothetical protein n=1 Tax=Nocardia farcinica TaxID=37329 RepID=UPI002458E73E|nr:hypothetical protein [Nocardia farcinica]